MKVIVKTRAVVGKGKVVPAGTLVDLPKDNAVKLIERGLAVVPNNDPAEAELTPPKSE